MRGVVRLFVLIAVITGAVSRTAESGRRKVIFQ